MSLVVMDGYLYAPAGGGTLQTLLRELGRFEARARSAAVVAMARQMSGEAARLADMCRLGLPLGSEVASSLARRGALSHV